MKKVTPLPRAHIPTPTHTHTHTHPHKHTLISCFMFVCSHPNTASHLSQASFNVIRVMVDKLIVSWFLYVNSKHTCFPRLQIIDIHLFCYYMHLWSELLNLMIISIVIGVACYSSKRKCVKIDLFSEVSLQTDRPCFMWNLLTPNVVTGHLLPRLNMPEYELWKQVRSDRNTVS